MASSVVHVETQKGLNPQATPFTPMNNATTKMMIGNNYTSNNQEQVLLPSSTKRNSDDLHNPQPNFFNFNFPSTTPMFLSPIIYHDFSPFTSTACYYPTIMVPANPSSSNQPKSVELLQPAVGVPDINPRAIRGAKNHLGGGGYERKRRGKVDRVNSSNNNNNESNIRNHQYYRNGEYTNRNDYYSGEVYHYSYRKENKCCYYKSSRRDRGICSNYCKRPREVQSVTLPLKPDGLETTVMIRNIPNRYSRDLLMEFLDRHCKTVNERAKLQVSSDGSPKDATMVLSAFDFLYLPIDFKKKGNKGYAFVNFTDPRAAWKLYTETNNQSWDLFQSSKIRDIASARLQGKEELVRHFTNSTFECESDEYLPVQYSPPRDGSNGSFVQQITTGKRTFHN